MVREGEQEGRRDGLFLPHLIVGGTWMPFFDTSYGQSTDSFDKRDFRVAVNEVGFSPVNYGRHLRVAYNSDGNPEIIVATWQDDGVLPDKKHTLDSPFAIRKYTYSNGVFRDSTSDNDVALELVRLARAGDLSIKDSVAILKAAAINEQKQRFKLSYTTDEVIETIKSAYGGKLPSLHPSFLKNMTKIFGIDNTKRFPGLVDRRTLGKSADILGRLQTRQPELYVAVAESVNQAKDPSEQIAAMLDVDSYLGREIFKTAIAPSLFTVDSETRRLQPLEFTLYREEGYADHTVPYQKDVVFIADPETRQLALKTGLYLGRDNRLGLDVRFTTTPEGIEARRFPDTSLVFVDDARVMERSASLYERAQKGSVTTEEFIRETDSIRANLGIAPQVDDAIRDLQTVASLATALYRRDKPEDIIRIIVGSGMSKEEIRYWKETIGLLGQAFNPGQSR